MSFGAGWPLSVLTWATISTFLPERRKAMVPVCVSWLWTTAVYWSQLKSACALWNFWEAASIWLRTLLRSSCEWAEAAAKMRAAKAADRKTVLNLRIVKVRNTELLDAVALIIGAPRLYRRSLYRWRP